MKNLSLELLSEFDQDYCFELVAKNMAHYFTKYQIAWDRDHFLKSLHKGIVRKICWEGERVGFFHWKEKDKCGYVSTIQIEPQGQNKGIGKAIMQHLESLTQQFGLKSIRLSVFLDNPAINFYERLGYVLIETSSQKLLMEKQL